MQEALSSIKTTPFSLIQNSSTLACWLEHWALGNTLSGWYTTRCTWKVWEAHLFLMFQKWNHTDQSGTQVIEKNPNYNPAPDCCSCACCGWHGKVSECYAYEESESWEVSQTYVAHDCPVCADGGMIDNYYFSLRASILYQIYRFWMRVRRVISTNTRFISPGDK